MAHEWRLFLVALQFLTRVPVPSFANFDPAWLHASARYFAAVGLVVGGLVATALYAASLVWPLPVAALVAIGFGIWMTGGFHEDGLADTWDALGGSVSRDRALEIMKDSRLGSYGALALLVVLGTKVAALCAVAQVSIGTAIATLVVGHVVGRAGTVGLIGWLRYAGDEAHAKAKPLAQRVDAPTRWFAASTAVLVALGCAAVGVPVVAVLAAIAAAAAAVLATGWWLRRRLGGYTGDGLGAAEQHAECAALLAVAALPLGAVVGALS